MAKPTYEELEKLESEQQRLIQELREALEEIKTLRVYCRFFPIAKKSEMTGDTGNR